MTEGIQGQDAEVEGTPDVSARLSDIPPERLVEEVISRWDELVRVEEELVLTRQRVRSLEMELGDQEGDGSLRGKVAELEESLRVADARIAQMEGLLENERRRRGDIEESVDRGRMEELQEENVRLLRSEEEQMILILDMEAQLDRLVSEFEGG